MTTSVDGNWTFTVKSMMGEMQGTLDLRSSGSKLTGTAEAAIGGRIPLENGKIAGDEVSWEAKITTPMKMTLKFAATFDADTMVGRVKAAVMPKAQFTARRVGSDDAVEAKLASILEARSEADAGADEQAQSEVTVDGVIYRSLRPVSDPASFYPGLHPEVVTLPAGSTYGPTGSEGDEGSRWHGGTRPLPTDILFERDVAVPLRDGTTIYVDIFRPLGATNVPAIVSWSPYGKEGGFWNHAVAHPIGKSPREEWISGLQKFEGPDPAEWVSHGYAVVNADARGSYSSEGDMQFFGEQEGRDGHDLVEWIAARDWSNGRVGMQGNSWLAVAQWFVAGEQPPHLAAIAPWNGFFDIYNDFVAAGGMPTPAFADFLADRQWGNRVEYLPGMLEKFPFKNSYWDTKVAQLEKITVPAYVAAMPQPGAFHRWTSEAFRRISSREKWLRIFNTDEWYFEYKPEYVADLRRFFDRYLKEERNGWEDTPRVRVAVLDRALEPGTGANPDCADAMIYVPAVEMDRPEQEWPVARTQYNRLYCDAGTLGPQPADAESAARYPGAGGEATFTHVFAETTELIGYAQAKLWVEVIEGQDADLFLRLDKLGADGRVHGVVNLESLRVSHRELDEARCTEFMVYQTHRREQPLEPGERVLITVGFAPMAVRFAAGEQLRLRVATDLGDPSTPGLELAAMSLPPVVRNAGTHVIHCGGRYDSCLVVPVVSPH